MQKSNRNRGKGGGARPQKSLGNIVNRVFESAGPEGKVRGTPQQIIDKYEQLARDAQTSGDRVMAENFLQHAEHYSRMLSAALAEMQAQQQQHQPQHHVHAQPHGQRRDDQGRREDGGQGGRPQGEDQPAPGGLQTIEPEDAPLEGRGFGGGGGEQPSGQTSGQTSGQPDGAEAGAQGGDGRPSRSSRRRRGARRGGGGGGEEAQGGGDAPSESRPSENRGPVEAAG